jgi:hypothetical protein
MENGKLCSHLSAQFKGRTGLRGYRTFGLCWRQPERGSGFSWMKETLVSEFRFLCFLNEDSTAIFLLILTALPTSLNFAFIYLMCVYLVFFLRYQSLH